MTTRVCVHVHMFWLFVLYLFQDKLNPSNNENNCKEHKSPQTTVCRWFHENFIIQPSLNTRINRYWRDYVRPIRYVSSFFSTRSTLDFPSTFFHNKYLATTEIFLFISNTHAETLLTEEWDWLQDVSAAHWITSAAAIGIKPGFEGHWQLLGFDHPEKHHKATSKFD